MKIKIEIKWAIIFSICVLIWMVLEKLSGLHGKYIDYHLYLTNLFAIPAVILVTMALKEKKKLFYKGKMSYRQGLISGIVLSLIIALFSPLTQWVTTYLITPGYFPTVIERSVELGYYETMEEAQKQFNFKNYVLQGLIGSFVMGVMTSLVVMIFLRDKKNI